MKIKLTKQALQNIYSIQAYLIEHEAFFLKLAQRFNHYFKLISNNPCIGAIGRRENTREFYISKTNYTVIYRTTHDIVEILTVLHPSRKH